MEETKIEDVVEVENGATAGTSPSSAFYTSFIKAQAEMKPVLKDSKNPHLKNMYASLQSVIDAIREPLNNNNLAFQQTTEIEGSRIVVVTRIVHVSGEFIESRFPIIAKNAGNVQDVGSGMTYARRYSLLAICGLAPEDDDGSAAAGGAGGGSSNEPASDSQKGYVKKLLTDIGANTDAKQKKVLAQILGTSVAVNSLTKAQAQEVIDELKED